MTRTRLSLYATAGVAALGLGVIGRTFAWLTAVPATIPSIGIVPKGGSLLICGGGRLSEEIRRRFLELAGGGRARIVVIPTALPKVDIAKAEENYLSSWRDLGATNLSLLHTRDRYTADDAEFVAPLREATGVWIIGGHPSRLSEAYAGTQVEHELKAVVKRGGVVGGTSAGAAIMTKVMLADDYRGAPLGEGFDLLEGAIIDSHFLKRRYYRRMADALSTHPQLLGFGIDEGTALLVRGNYLSVLGSSYVVVYLPRQTNDVPPRVEFLRNGDEADLASLKGAEPRIVTGLNVDDVLSADP